MPLTPRDIVAPKSATRRVFSADHKYSFDVLTERNPGAEKYRAARNEELVRLLLLDDWEGVWRRNTFKDRILCVTPGKDHRLRIEYKIAQHRYLLRLLSGQFHRYPPHFRWHNRWPDTHMHNNLPDELANEQEVYLSSVSPIRISLLIDADAATNGFRFLRKWIFQILFEAFAKAFVGL